MVCSGRPTTYTITLVYRCHHLDNTKKNRYVIYSTSLQQDTITQTFVYVENNKVRELLALRVLRTSLLNTTVVAFKVLSLGSYAPMPAPSPPFKTILELI